MCGKTTFIPNIIRHECSSTLINYPSFNYRSQPIEISFSLVEVILTAKSKSEFLYSKQKAALSKIKLLGYETIDASHLSVDSPSRFNKPPVTPARKTLSSVSDTNASSVPMWLQGYLSKVLANISLNVDNVGKV